MRVGPLKMRLEVKFIAEFVRKMESNNCVKRCNFYRCRSATRISTTRDETWSSSADISDVLQNTSTETIHLEKVNLLVQLPRADAVAIR